MKLYYLFRFGLLVVFMMISYTILKSFNHHTLNQTTVSKIEEHQIVNQTKSAVKLYYTVLIDPHLTATEVRIIHEALNEWQYTTNGIVMFRPIMGFNIPELKRMENDTIYKTIAIKPMEPSEPLVILVDSVINANGQIDAGIVGYFDHNNMTNQKYLTLYIVRNRVDSENEYRTIVIHELAHSWEMQHLKDTNTIMYPSENGSSNCITIIDLKYMCLLYKCDEEVMFPCYNSHHPLVCSNETFHTLY